MKKSGKLTNVAVILLVSIALGFTACGSGGAGTNASANKDTTSAKNDSTPANGDSTPATGDSTPATGDSTPANKDTTSAKNDSTPATGDSTPATGDSTPANSGVVIPDNYAGAVTLQFGEMGVDVSLDSTESKGLGYPIAKASKRSLDFPAISHVSLATLQTNSLPRGANDLVNNIKFNGGALPSDATMHFTTSGGGTADLKLQVHFYYPVSPNNNTTVDSTYSFNFLKYNSVSNFYGVYGPGDLSYIRIALGANYQQMKTIDFSQVTSANSAKLGIADYDTNGWLPIGDTTVSNRNYASSYQTFTGSYNGGDLPINKLTIHRLAVDYQGLFGCLVGNISHTNLVNTLVEGGYYTGGLVGYEASGAISQSYTTGKVTSTTGYYVGGLVGYQTKGSISQSYSTGAVSSTSGNYVGGLVGVQNSGSISQAYSTGAVSSTSGTSVGGLVGYQNSSISQAYATGTVSSASGSYVGGLVGLQSIGSISQVFATGAVSTTSGDALGGLVGLQNSGSISQVFATGTVSTKSGNNVGGLVGMQNQKITEAYATGSVIAKSAKSKGGLVGYQKSGVVFTNTYYLKGANSYFGVGSNSSGVIYKTDAAGVKAVTAGAVDASFAGFQWVDSTSTTKLWTHTGANNGNKGHWPLFGEVWLNGWGPINTQSLQPLP